jgi:hypothetical protein
LPHASGYQKVFNHHGGMEIEMFLVATHMVIKRLSIAIIAW